MLNSKALRRRENSTRAAVSRFRDRNGAEHTWRDRELTADDSLAPGNLAIDSKPRYRDTVALR